MPAGGQRAKDRVAYPAISHVVERLTAAAAVAVLLLLAERDAAETEQARARIPKLAGNRVELRLELADGEEVAAELLFDLEADIRELESVVIYGRHVAMIEGR